MHPLLNRMVARGSVMMYSHMEALRLGGSGCEGSIANKLVAALSLQLLNRRKWPVYALQGYT